MDKTQIKQLLLSTLNDKVYKLRCQIDMLADGAQNDAKSSAGDKHETSLSMMHLEQEKLNNKLSEIHHLLEQAKRLPEKSVNNMVGLGSVVETNHALFYISVAAQPIVYQNKTIICVSTQAPLIQKMIGLKHNDELTYNALTYKILKIM